jgi:hypothetical protein
VLLDSEIILDRLKGMEVPQSGEPNWEGLGTSMTGWFWMRNMFKKCLIF